MADATAEFFEQLAEREHEPLLEKVTGTLRFDLKDNGRTARWRVAIKKGDVAVSRANQAADCVVRTDRATFEKIVAGKTNPFAAVLRGTVGLEGDPELIVQFQRIFRAEHS
jgi:putative sterol carrier protein